MDQIHIKPEVFEIPYSEDEGDLHENNEEEYIYENGQDPLGNFYYIVYCKENWD